MMAIVPRTPQIVEISFIYNSMSRCERAWDTLARPCVLVLNEALKIVRSEYLELRKGVLLL